MQIKKIDSFVEIRNRNYQRYADVLKNKTRIQQSGTDLVSSLGFAVIDENRESIINDLNINDIEVRPLICGSIQEHPFWNTRYEKRSLPNAAVVHKNGFYVPCHQNMSLKEVDYICQLILKNL
jgi:dTDP-4-amino-4,6-dideoxygalactose transaminase